MSNLVSGMVLRTKKYEDIHYLVATPFGYRVIDLDGEIINFQPENYTKAYIPKGYDNGEAFIPLPGTEIILGGN